MIEMLRANPELATTKSGLCRLGFTGFRTIRDLQRWNRGKNVGCAPLPRAHGVYAVVSPPEFAACFLEKPNPVTLVSGYPTSELEASWVEGVDVLNFSKAESKKNGLRGRIRQYVRFGLGDVANHAGGRSIWQLTEASSLAIGYRPTDDLGQSAREIDLLLVAGFKKATRRTPFAWREGQSATRDRRAASHAPCNGISATGQDPTNTLVARSIKDVRVQPPA